MRDYGALLAHLRSRANLSWDGLARVVGTSKSTLSRLENDDSAQPFKGTMRKLVLWLARVLCTSRRETERYLERAGIDRSWLTDMQEAQLGCVPYIVPGSPEEQAHFERLALIYRELREQLEAEAVRRRRSRSKPKSTRTFYEKSTESSISFRTGQKKRATYKQSG